MVVQQAAVMLATALGERDTWGALFAPQGAERPDEPVSRSRPGPASAPLRDGCGPPTPSSLGEQAPEGARQ